VVVYAYNMARHKKKEHDFAITAFRVVQEATGQGVDYSVLGREGGLKGGKARAEKLTPEERSSIAKKAANARWGKKEE
jgi:hypothetical protein